jgi:glycosyltransferase involved in cell wall biosynthesis
MKIIHTYLSYSSFIRKDAAIFSSIGDLENYEFKIKSKLLLPFSFLSQILFLLTAGWKADIFIIQFSGYHAFLPTLFARITGKKSVIISGGTDCVSFPGIDYGYFNKPILKTFTKWSYQLCHHILPKHESLWYCDYHYDTNEPSKQGIKAFIPNLKIPHTIITNGYDSEQWPLLKLERKKNSFITLSGAFEYPFQVQLKGIDLILAIAPHFPDCTFTIAGVPSTVNLNIHSNNIIILPPIHHGQLPALFNTYEYYLQLSMAEGFPNALCEAMLCGCTPIVSDVFSMREIIKNEENLLHTRNHDQLVRLIQRNLNHISETPEVIRIKILSRYNLQLRKEKLLAILSSLQK